MVVIGGSNLIAASLVPQYSVGEPDERTDPSLLLRVTILQNLQSFNILSHEVNDHAIKINAGTNNNFFFIPIFLPVKYTKTL